LKCKVCSEESKYLFDAKILNKYNVKYFKCPKCNFLQTEKPYWLKEAYSDAISVSDTGVMSRNNDFAKTATVILSLVSDKAGQFLDYGGGYGVFTRLMRDKGFDFFWYDKYAKNLVSRGFEGDMQKKKYAAVTSFENFEHFEKPIEDIEKIFNLTDIVLFSTELVPEKAPDPNQWWYYCLEHGQHISLYSKESLEYIAKKYGYYFISNDQSLHIFSRHKISKGIFLIARIIKKIRLDKFFEQSSKTNSDMHMMIKEMSRK